MTLAPIRSAEHAASYYEQSDHADYYARDDVCVSSWEGKAAEIIGIQGQAVDKERFKRYLNGEIAREKVGTVRNGEHHHKPGFDLQFAPPKSVSVVALVGGDERVVQAHNDAVKASIKLLEEKATFTRKHTRDENGKDVMEHQATGNLLCAVFKHDTSRKLDPQLHSHAAVLNLSRVENLWKSIESRHFYCLQKEIGLYYRQHLSASLKELGYKINRQQDASFEIAGVPDDVIKVFSQRRDEIERELEKQGYTRETAPSSLKEKIAHRFRDKKIYVEPENLLKEWKCTEKEKSFSSEELVQEAMKNNQCKEWSDQNKLHDYERLQKIAKTTVLSISERDAVFSKEELVNKINQQAVGYGIPSDRVDVYVSELERSGELIGGRKAKVYSSQFQQWQEVDAVTTPQSIEQENKMINFVQESRSLLSTQLSSLDIENIIDDANQESITQGYDGWNAGQKTVTRGLLSCNDQVVGVQGYAGTAKTSTVLRTISKVFMDKDYEVIGMAPSASACDSLKDGAGLNDAITVASHLLQSRFNSDKDKKQLWLVDEASLLPTKDMAKLFEQAGKHQAKVILVGDVQQLGSVEAGAAFRQLQENGLTTFKLDEIVRQENIQTLDAVYASIEADAKQALDYLQSGGGDVIQIKGNAENRHNEIVERYLSLLPEERDETLLIEPSREGREILSNLLRDELKERGEISKVGYEIDRLDKIDLTKASQEDVMNYSLGDAIKFSRTYKRQGVDKNSYWTIISRDINKNTILLKDDSGREVIWNPSSWGKKIQAFRPEESELTVGDKIIWTLNNRDKGLTNGMKAHVVDINRIEGNVQLKFSGGEIHTLKTSELESQHWSHNYVTTAHGAQGMTSERVIYHAESFRKNLASQKAFYVAISRAKQGAIVVTDDRKLLISQLHEHSGEKQYSLEGKDNELDASN